MKTRILATLALAAASARVCVLAGEVLEDERAPSKSKWDLAGRVDPAPTYESREPSSVMSMPRHRRPRRVPKFP